MARNVFFSFDYQRDIRRVVKVLNSWVVRGEKEAQPFLDPAEWETLKRTSGKAIENWIEAQLKDTSVTVVLFGAETFDQTWVTHEIKRSHELGKGILAIDIHGVKDRQAGQETAGRNPLDHWSVTRNAISTPFTQLYMTYDWVLDDGRKNMGGWIEAAAKAAGR